MLQWFLARSNFHRTCKRNRTRSIPGVEIPLLAERGCNSPPPGPGSQPSQPEKPPLSPVARAAPAREGSGYTVVAALEFLSPDVGPIPQGPLQ